MDLAGAPIAAPASRLAQRAPVRSVAVVNTVSAYVEKAGVTFEAVHVKGAETVAREAVAAAVARLVLVSGIGAVCA